VNRLLYGQMGGITPDDQRRVQADLQGELEAIQQYEAHAVATSNAQLQRLWQRIRQDEVRHAHWLQMALAGRIPGAGMMGMMGGMGQMGGMGGQMGAMEHMAAFSPGQVVVPTVAHMPEHVDRAAQVLEVVHSPVYVLDFGDGKPHRWYVESELKRAPAGTRAGQQVPGATVEEQFH
jgi:hypothetical protein